jgi:hypothetical protein
MYDDHEDKSKKAPAIVDDGFGHDYGDNRRSRRGVLGNGAKLKYVAGKGWSVNDVPMAHDRELIALRSGKFCQKWLPEDHPDHEPGDGPVETFQVASGEPWPDTDAMNAACPPEERSNKFGPPKGPWENIRVLYLFDPKTMQRYSYATPTTGGMMAIEELRDATELARRMHGPTVCPRVLLRETPMKTKYGPRMRPYFEIRDFGSMGPTPPPQIETKRDDGRPHDGEGAAEEPPFLEDPPFEPDDPAGAGASAPARSARAALKAAKAKQAKKTQK